MECFKTRNKQPNARNIFFWIPALEELVLAKRVWRRRPQVTRGSCVCLRRRLVKMCICAILLGDGIEIRMLLLRPRSVLFSIAVSKQIKNLDVCFFELVLFYVWLIIPTCFGDKGFLKLKVNYFKISWQSHASINTNIRSGVGMITWSSPGIIWKQYLNTCIAHTLGPSRAHWDEYWIIASYYTG